MAWRSDTKPTAANVRKRLESAEAALEAAIALAEKHGGMPRAITAAGHALGWTRSAHSRATGKGR